MQGLDVETMTLEQMVDAIVEPIGARLAVPEALLLQLSAVAIYRYHVNFPESLWWTGVAQRILNRRFPLGFAGGYRFPCRDVNILLYKHVSTNVYRSTRPYATHESGIGLALYRHVVGYYLHRIVGVANNEKVR